MKWGYPNWFMVYNGKSDLEMEENWGYPYFRKLLFYKWIE
jgi:hypothetical protein